jgi:ABC-type oligopeptide transport system ATPase subunit
MNTQIINLFGGPGTGKSTIAALVFGELKKKGYEIELVTEYAKDKVWEESYKTLENQIYVFGKQLHRIWRIKNKVNFIITDSPILLSIIYDKEKNDNLKRLVLDVHNNFNNINILIKRDTIYNPNGRFQNEIEAKLIDKQIMNLLKNNSIDFHEINITNAVEEIINIITKKEDN